MCVNVPENKNFLFTLVHLMLFLMQLIQFTQQPNTILPFFKDRAHAEHGSGEHAAGKWEFYTV